MENKVEEESIINEYVPEENLGLIQIGDGVYCRVNSVKVDCDIVDANGNPLEKNGVKQAPHSEIKLNGSDLVGLELPVQIVANKVYGLA